MHPSKIGSKSITANYYTSTPKDLLSIKENRSENDGILKKIWTSTKYRERLSVICGGLHTAILKGNGEVVVFGDNQ